MSKVTAKKTDSPATTQQQQQPTKNNNAVKKKKKFWKTTKAKVKDTNNAKSQQTLPPKDAQQFSANWKTLQEMLKASQSEMNQSQTPKPQNGPLQKVEAKEKSSKIIPKNNAGPSQTDSGKAVKHKAVPNKAVPNKAVPNKAVPSKAVPNKAVPSKAVPNKAVPNKAVPNKAVPNKVVPSKAVPNSSDSQVNVKGSSVSQTGQPSASKRKKDNTNRLDREKGAKKTKLVVEETKPTEADIWFDDVDPDDIEATMGPEAAEIMRKKQGIQKNKEPENALVKERAFEGLTRAVAIDCEMVGVGPDGEDSILARVSLVNQFGKCIYDKYVKPTEKVTDYRTAVSGIRPQDIKDGEDVRTVQGDVADILQGRVVVGHAIHNDLKILLLDHPKKKIRDTQKYKPFKKSVKSGRPSLKLLCREILNVKVQQGEHSSVQDAQATMRLYTLVKKQWEAEIKASRNNKDSNKKLERRPKRPRNKGNNHLRGL